MKQFLSMIGLALVLGSGVAAAERPRDLVVPVSPSDLDPATVPPQVNTKVLFLNNCKPNGCAIHRGTPNSQSDTWYASGTLTPFSDSDATWDAVVRCVRQTFAPFDITITTTDPGTAPHFEIMIAGSSGDIGLPSNVGGISPSACGMSYFPNSLVFDFSKTWAGKVDEICAVAAQEIAHSFTLDHSTDASDPLTYFGYAGRRAFRDAQVQCGSDCTTGAGRPCMAGDTGCRAPDGSSCFGSPQQSHACTCTGSQTQNSVQTITSLFGARAAIPPPTVMVTYPLAGAAVTPGFQVRADVTPYLDLATVALSIDGVALQMVASAPYIFNAPATMAKGTHHVQVVATDIKGTQGMQTVDVVIGDPCTKPADCPDNTQTCVGGRCVPGAGVQGGLGTTCTANTECSSGLCGSDGTGTRYCVETCDPTKTGICPPGFACLGSAPSGVCWPSADSGGGGGGGCASGSSGGPILLGLAFAALVLRRRGASAPA
jgi:hypothetical protein